MWMVENGRDANPRNPLDCLMQLPAYGGSRGVGDITVCACIKSSGASCHNALLIAAAAA
jgi:hypothetical protein